LKSLEINLLIRDMRKIHSSVLAVFGLVAMSSTGWGQGWTRVREPDSRWALYQPEKFDAVRDGARIASPENPLPAFEISVSVLRGLTMATFVQQEAKPPELARPFRFRVHAWQQGLLFQRDMLFHPAPETIASPHSLRGRQLLASALILANRPLRRLR
jgi:hypothetical protein